MSRIFINLPVIDLGKSIEFYKAIGFTQNLNFTDQNASAMVWDETIHVMLLTHSFYQGFLWNKKIANAHETAQVLNALEFESREHVNTFFEKAISAGWKATINTYDYGFMYGRDFEDLDGHIWEAFWMDETQMPKE
jgi:uncharacterized protein